MQYYVTNDGRSGGVGLVGAEVIGAWEVNSRDASVHGVTFGGGSHA